ncbi:hypothetical protein JYB62_17705 [Algoriphagus lutimaris]|uniref:hypothetical protein n=1 Tax=Algoriphagus lutimaris TaxID=613197 RepID=UPI00196A91E3|nr:hypothetical protein [Algoriphagus lutimaris]MBN3521848.1 hypothetical protein [Algoriphagus lutimaris]
MQIKKLEKTIPEVVQKLEKLNIGDTLAAELTWCWGSFKYDQNPEGVIEKSQKAIELLKEAKEINSRAVSKKLLDDFEKSLS